MVRFEYEAVNAAGQQVRSAIEAATVEEALVQIRSTGVYPTKVREDVRALRGKAKVQPVTRRRGRMRDNHVLGAVSKRALAECTQQLSILQDAGLPIVRSLRILEEQQRAGLLKQVLARVSNDVEDGATLSEAMERHPKVFDRLYVNMVRAGESGGVLDVILQRLSEFMEKSQRLKRRIIGAMIYPCAVIAFSVLIVTGIMMFVVPKFREIFRDFHTTLPAITEWLIGTSDWIARQYGWVVILASPVALVGLVKVVGRSAGGRWVLDSVKVRLPIIGQIVSRTAIARFTRTLGTLLAAGVPILDAMKITRETVGNVVYESALQKVQDAIREGEGFAGTLRATRVCDSIVSNMIDVGEETGELDKMLMKIADNYDERVDVLVGSLVSLLEPVMVVVLGGIVGTIVVALFLPMVRLLQPLLNGG